MRGNAGNISRSCPAVTLNIGVFFDGTGNNSKNTESKGRSASYKNAKSNVALLAPLYKSGKDYDDDNSCGAIGVKYASLYVPGIGTKTGESDWWPGTIAGAGLGMGATGVEARVLSACLEIGNMVRKLSPAEEPKEIIMDVFGFSRGAAAARYFVNCFRQGFVEYYRNYVSRQYAYVPKGRNVRFRFVGVFDTVAAFGDAEDDDNGAVNVHLSTAQAEQIWHLTAKHEYRTKFRLNHNLPGGGNARELLGAHSDVGGGYRDKGNKVRVDGSRTHRYATRAEAERAHQAATAAAAAARNSAASFWIQDGWIRPNEPTGGLVNAPSPIRVVPVNMFVNVYTFSTGAILDRPWVEVGLSRIPLRIMYDKALAAKVPLLPFRTDAEYVIPAPLAQLAGSLATGGAMPSVANQREILRNYGHVSSDLSVTEVGMSPQLGTAGQRLWHRTVYPNEVGKAK